MANAQLSKPVSHDSQLEKNKYNTRTAAELDEILFGTDATGFQPKSNCQHNIDIIWTTELDSSIYQTPTITYLDARSPYKDIVIPTFIRYVEALHGPTGSEKHGSDDKSIWPFSHMKFASHSSALLYDIDEDHEQEVVVPTANAEVVFLKSTGKIIKEKTLKLLPLRLDKNWFQGLNDDTMDISMNLMKEKGQNDRKVDQNPVMEQEQVEKRHMNQKNMEKIQQERMQMEERQMKQKLMEQRNMEQKRMEQELQMKLGEQEQKNKNLTEYTKRNENNQPIEQGHVQLNPNQPKRQQNIQQQQPESNREGNTGDQLKKRQEPPEVLPERNLEEKENYGNRIKSRRGKDRMGRGRKLLQIDNKVEMRAGTRGSLSAEAKESMKLIHIPQPMRALIDEIDRLDDPFEPENYGQQLKEQIERDKKAPNFENSIYVDAHLLNNPVIIDLDKDGHDEIIFAPTYFFDSEYYESDPFHMSNLDLGIDIHKYVAGGIVVYDIVTMKKKWEVHLDLTTDRTKTRAYIYSTPTVVDIDSDGSLEVIVATSMGWIYVIDKHGKPKEGFPVLMAEIQGQIITEDINNDGDLEICAVDANANVVCFNYKGKTVWEKVVHGRISTAPAVADLNGDGILDLIVATTSGQIWALRGDNGAVLPGYPIKTNGAILSTPAVLGGMNKTNSSSLTIIAPSHDGYIYLIDAKSLCIDKIDIGERIYSQILIDDVTGNGNLDLIVTTMNGNVFNLGTEVPYDALKTITSSSTNTFAYRPNYHGIAITEQSRQFRDEFGSNFKVEFDIIDKRKMPSHIPRQYTIRITIGGTQLLLENKIYHKDGRYIVTVPTPQKRFYGKVIVTMFNEHGQRFEDSFNLGFHISFLNIFKWMILVPFMLSSSLLLYLFGTDTNVEQKV